MVSEAPPARTNSGYKSLTQIILENIRQQIYDGVYGPGTRINILDLAQEFNASSIPVREALRNLETEGLVEFRPNRGVVIRGLSADEVRELYLMRLPLEVLAATQAALKADKASLKALRKILAKMDSVTDEQQWHSLHEKFHHEFYLLSKFPRLAQHLDILRGQMRPYSKTYLSNPVHIAKAQEEHNAMIDAALIGDTETLRQLIRVHLKRPARLALASFGETELAEFEVLAEP
jgi:DNA-binding GntR family transcriptional regulator